MPVLKEESIKPSLFFNGAHRQTILPNILRRVDLGKYERQRLNLADGDFVDLDWLKIGSKKLVIALHGLEGDSSRHYIKGVLKEMSSQGWDGLGFNFRGCSGEANIKPRFYHSGDTKDLSYLIEKLEKEGYYEKVVVVGYSLGANVALLYAGQKGDALPSIVKAVVAVSVPCDLTSSVTEIHRMINRHYIIWFLISLKKKVRQKKELLADFDIPWILKSKDLIDWDNRLTAPVHGFTDAADYWAKASSLPYLENIKVPSLIINAQNDTFLSKLCSPIDLAERSKLLYLSSPIWGGPVGFVEQYPWDTLWSERKTSHFLTKIIGL